MPCYFAVAACYASQAICEIDRLVFSASTNPLCKLALLSHTSDGLRLLSQTCPTTVLWTVKPYISRILIHWRQTPVSFNLNYAAYGVRPTPLGRTVSLLPQFLVLLQNQYLATIHSMQTSTVRELFWRKASASANAGEFAGEFLGGLGTLPSTYQSQWSSLTSQWTTRPLGCYPKTIYQVARRTWLCGHFSLERPSGLWVTSSSRKTAKTVFPYRVGCCRSLTSNTTS